ncbi:DUF4351 domain-containing protein [Plectonema cf. radiosum LEGE 06105]|uniref:DUF4351 domain-containing protein n=1 Tax=Plectonema cf. radiosum LEGE 06105 TaxID=945769 RepID=A0A8J7F2N0_9CYAN|nr:DUF4351 domain-containing protein [Plectonema radiosum]MBE9213767.1 DUF4351 domain-containing protein [Plectonema cf. radiosum LEGE 06105]
MTRFIHDEFAKDYLEELLKNYGTVEPDKKVSGEKKEIDILFTPSAQQTYDLQLIGVLGRFAEYPAILEPFRNAAPADEICDCIIKVLEVKAKMRREAKANNTKLQEEKIPKLWVLTPTASETVLSGFNIKQKEGWLPGVYFLGDNLRSAIVAIHQLPKTTETLWLRLLGRGRVQEQAILELQDLPPSNPFQQATLKLVYNLRENLRANQNLDLYDRELIVRLEPLYQEDRERAKQEGREEGIIDGEKRLVIRQLNRRLGEINSSLIDRINGLSIERLETLGEALLDFTSVADLESWLNQQEA